MHSIALAIVLIGIIYAPFIETKGTFVCLQEDIVNNTLELTCTVLDPKLPISFYKGNDKKIVARCFINPEPQCFKLVNYSSITYDISKNQATFKTWDLKSINGNWTCSHGGKNDSSSSVLIKEKVCKDTCNTTEKVCKDFSKIEETSFWIFTIFVISFVIMSVIIKWLDIQWRPDVFNRLRTSQFLGFNVLTPCTLLVILVLISYFLENTTEGIILGCIIAAIVGALIPYIQNLNGG